MNKKLNKIIELLEQNNTLLAMIFERDMPKFVIKPDSSLLNLSDETKQKLNEQAKSDREIIQDFQTKNKEQIAVESLPVREMTRFDKPVVTKPDSSFVGKVEEINNIVSNLQEYSELELAIIDDFRRKAADDYDSRMPTPEQEKELQDLLDKVTDEQKEKWATKDDGWSPFITLNQFLLREKLSDSPAT
jgi:hypothetical protein